MKLEEGMLSVFPAWLCKGLPPPEQTVLCWLWHHKQTSPNDRFPSVTTLSVECGLTKRSVHTQLQSLVKRKLIRIFRREHPDGGLATNHYEVNMIPGEADSLDMNELRSPAKKTGWTAARWLEIHKKYAGGYFQVERHARQMKQVEKDYGHDKTLSGFEMYCKNTEPRFISVARFCATAGAWMMNGAKHEYDEAVSSGRKRW